MINERNQSRLMNQIKGVRTILIWLIYVKFSCSSLYYFCLYRYTINLDHARAVGIKKGFVSGASFGNIFLIMYSTYGLAFWYGSTLIFEGTIMVGDMLTAFFGVLIGSFSLGQVWCCYYNKIKKVF